MSKKHKKNRVRQLLISAPKDPKVALEQEIFKYYDILEKDIEVVKGKEVPLSNTKIQDIKNKIALAQDKLFYLQNKTE